MEYPGFIGASNSSQSPLADCERLVNLYYEPNDVGSGRPALYPTPGASSWGTATDVGTRALFEMNGRAFGVIGPGAYELFANHSLTKYGDLTLDSNPAQIIVNGITGNQAGFASGGNLSVLNLTTNTLSAPVLTGTANQIGFLNGYGIAFYKAAGRINVSNLNDFTAWDPTQFAFRSSSPDNWQGMGVNPPNVFLLGEQTGEVWSISPATFPLAPRPGVNFPYGIAATYSLAVAGDSIIWLSRNADGAGILVRARGYNPLPIGSFAFNSAVAEYQRTSTITDAYALVFQRKGHTFYALSFPTANATWAYDLQTDRFFELGQWNARLNRYDAWHPSAITYAFGQHLIGERTTARISMLDDTVGTEADGSPIRRLRIPPPLRARDGGRIFIDRFELGIQPGVASATGQGSNPLAMLRGSRDYAQTWGNETTRSIGRIGETSKRVFWTRLGSSPISWVPEVVISDPVPTRIVSASVQGRGMANAASQAA